MLRVLTGVFLAAGTLTAVGSVVAAPQAADLSHGAFLVSTGLGLLIVPLDRQGSRSLLSVRIGIIVAGSLGFVAGCIFLAGNLLPRTWILRVLTAYDAAIYVQSFLLELAGYRISLYDSHVPAAMLTRDWLLLLTVTFLIVAFGARVILAFLRPSRR